MVMVSTSDGGHQDPIRSPDHCNEPGIFEPPAKTIPRYTEALTAISCPLLPQAMPEAPTVWNAATPSQTHGVRPYPEYLEESGRECTTASYSTTLIRTFASAAGAIGSYYDDGSSEDNDDNGEEEEGDIRDEDKDRGRDLTVCGPCRSGDSYDHDSLGGSYNTDRDTAPESESDSEKESERHKQPDPYSFIRHSEHTSMV